MVLSLQHEMHSFKDIIVQTNLLHKIEFISVGNFHLSLNYDFITDDEMTVSFETTVKRDTSINVKNIFLLFT